MKNKEGPDLPKSTANGGEAARPETATIGQERIFEGLAVSPGVAIGPAYLRDTGDIQIAEYVIEEAAVTTECQRFTDAVAKATRQLSKLRVKASHFHGAAAEELGYLLDAHRQMLSSSRLLKGVKQRIANNLSNAESAVVAEIDQISASFAEMDDSYLAARAEEIREVGMRIVRNLSDKQFSGFGTLPPDSIIIAEEITPADTALMDPQQVGGFASVLGGAEGHTSIMARSLGLPAVLGAAGVLEGIRAGDTVIIDGSNGLVIVNPSARRLDEYQRRREEMARETRALEQLRHVPAITLDDEKVSLQVNLELPREVGQALAVGAEGVGLLRTEFLFMNREDPPSEEEQYQVLREMVEAMGGQPITVRTLDIGGEKLATSVGLDQGESLNPALGLRAIRLSLKDRTLLDNQLAAMLRAANHGPVRILLPMISTVSEVIEVRRALGEVAEKLAERGQPVPNPLPPLGVMIEVPGAALSADALAKVSDFFAIGTNDLTMYTLAIDRGEERVAHLYNPLHPAVLRLIQFSTEAALRARLPVSVCGEIAGDPRYTALLLGLGVRDLSMTANALPRVKSRIRALDMQAANRRAQVIMDQVDSGRIAALLDDFNSLA